MMDLRLSRRSALSGLAALSLIAALPAVAAPPVAAALKPADRADLDRIEQYLNGIRTMSGRFTQFAQDGGTAAGSVYLSRPGKMRFDYDKPSPILLVADGTFVVYLDYSLKESTYLPISSTPAWFLLRDKVSLSDGITVTRFERGAGVLRVSLVETKSPEDGTLTLVFSDKPMELRQWTIVDAQGKQTTVALSDTKFGVPLDPKVFD